MTTANTKRKQSGNPPLAGSKEHKVLVSARVHPRLLAKARVFMKKHGFGSNLSGFVEKAIEHYVWCPE